MSDQTTDENATEVELEELTQDGAAAAPAEAGSNGSMADVEPAENTQKFATDLQAVFDVPVKVSAILGKTNMEVSDLLKLGRGAIVELDRKVGEAIDIYVNNRLVARGEVVIVEERLGVTMTEIIKGGQV